MREKEHHRRSPRLPHYDYGQAGAYFVTICVKDRACVLGKVEGEEMKLSKEGDIVQAVWDELPRHYANIELDEFVIMPNHIHGIVLIKEREDSNVGAGFKPAPTKPEKRHGLSEIVRGFKTFSARRINEMNDTTGSPFWQRGYYEHIIRNDEALLHHRRYIHQNPLKWSLDEYHREAPYA